MSDSRQVVGLGISTHNQSAVEGSCYSERDVEMTTVQAGGDEDCCMPCDLNNLQIMVTVGVTERMEERVFDLQENGADTGPDASRWEYAAVGVVTTSDRAVHLSQNRHGLVAKLPLSVSKEGEF